MKSIKLSNGIEIPQIGFGTFQITDPSEVEEAVRNALQSGYRHIDTAQSYQNEVAVGRGLVTSGVPRSEVFLTTKIWVENVSYEGVLKSFQDSLERLKVDYVDLLLIHQPYNDVYGAWRGMEELQREGKIKAIGVSNFSVDRVVDLAQFNQVAPQVNQIEINPFHQQKEVVAMLKNEGVIPESWAPFAEGKNEIFSNPILQKIGDQYNKTIAQVIVRWLVEQDVVVLAKSVNVERMKENIDVFDFELSLEDKKAIESLDVSVSQFFSHSDPEMIKWMASRKLGL